MSDIKLADLTDEQRAELLAEMKAEQEAKDLQEAKEGAWVFTNALNAVLIIPDLGIATPGGAFEAESFQPFEVKDLSEIYSPEELKKSKYLRMLMRDSDGRLLKGTHSTDTGEQTKNGSKIWSPNDDLQVKQNPLVIMAKNNPTGTFTDPSSAQNLGEYGSNAYDQRLQELHAKEDREDMETRRR